VNLWIILTNSRFDCMIWQRLRKTSNRARCAEKNTKKRLRNNAFSVRSADSHDNLARYSDVSAMRLRYP
jgi:hypothetical protein